MFMFFVFALKVRFKHLKFEFCQLKFDCSGIYFAVSSLETTVLYVSNFLN